MSSFIQSRRAVRLLVLPAVLLGAVACESSTAAEEDHSEFSRVEVATRGAAAQTIAVWTAGQGWRDPRSNVAITELPDSRDVEGEGLVPLRAGGSHASLSVRFFDRQNAQIGISTVARQAEQPRDRTCSEDEVRYAPTVQSTNVIAWPNVRHPSNPTGPFHWALRADEPVPVFHCDHVYFHPTAVGTVDVAFVLWHDDHADGETDPIRVRVLAAN